MVVTSDSDSDDVGSSPAPGSILQPSDPEWLRSGLQNCLMWVQVPSRLPILKSEMKRTIGYILAFLMLLALIQLVNFLSFILFLKLELSYSIPPFVVWTFNALFWVLVGFCSRSLVVKQSTDN